MKKKGAKQDFAEERIKDLMRGFEMLVRERRHVKMGTLCKKLVKMPASRFWVSEDRARDVVGAMLRGQQVLNGMRESKRRMFVEIFERVQALLQREPKRSLTDCIVDVIYSPAPEYYMEPGNASYLIYQSLKGE